MQTPGIILLCDCDGKIREVRRDDFGLTDAFRPGVPLSIAVDRDSLGKALSFLREIREQGSAVDWAMNVTVAEELVTLTFLGVAQEERWLIVAAYNQDDAARLYEEVPAALKLRELQTLVDIAREKTLIVVTPSGDMGTGSVAGLTAALNRELSDRESSRREDEKKDALRQAALDALKAGR